MGNRRSVTTPVVLSAVEEIRMWRVWDEEARAAGEGGVESLDLRDKVVAGGLAIGTAMVMTMMQLGYVYALGLALLAVLLSKRRIRGVLLPPGRETFAAYYVAWLYGPLGWGLYRRVWWARVAGALTFALLIARLAGV